MPIYTYTCDGCGKSEERSYTVEGHPEKIRCKCGKYAQRDVAADMRGYRHSPEVHEPHWNSALGVSRDQIGEMQSFLANKGFKPHECEFNGNGDIKILNRSHQKKVLKARGLVNLDGGYGD